MPLIQELGHRQILQGLDEAVRRRVPVSVTCCRDGHWHNLRSRLLGRAGDSLWLEWPQVSSGDDLEIVPGLELGFSFKLKHHKHIFNMLSLIHI